MNGGVDRRGPEDIRIPELVEELVSALDVAPAGYLVLMCPETFDRWVRQVGRRPGRGVKPTIGILWRGKPFRLRVVCREDAPRMVVVMPREDLRR